MGHGAPSHYFCGQRPDRAADLPLVRWPASIGECYGPKSLDLLDSLMRQDSDNYRVAEVGPRAPAPRDMARHRGRQIGDSNLSLPPAAEPLRASQRDRAVCRQLPRAAREQSAPPTERPSARTEIRTRRRPGPAILAGPLRRRTGTAAKTAAAQVGKRCQLSNGTRHGYIIAPTYDNAPGVAWPAVP
jgi:hypothetical protein